MKRVVKRVLKTPEFSKWFAGLRDSRAAALIDTRIKRLAEGNPGYSRFLGGVWEMKIGWGPGYRVYYAESGREIVVLLCGGDKRGQQSGIETARELAAKYRKEK